MVAVRPALSDATERVPPKHIAGHAPNLEGHAPWWPCPALSDATERVPPKHIAGHAPNLEGHARSWPCPPRGGPRSVVAVFSVLADATAARPSNLVAAAGRFRL